MVVVVMVLECCDISEQVVVTMVSECVIVSRVRMAECDVNATH